MKKRLSRLLAVCAVLLVLCAGAFGLYVSDYSRAEPAALALAAQAQTQGRYTTLAPTGQDTGVGVVFYPGGKVEAAAYLPLLQQLAQQGVTCVLVRMPCNLAFFGAGLAEGAMALHPQVERWYLMGHSLGGAFACTYAEQHPDEIAGVVLLGAYVYGGLPAEKTLVLYGEHDLVLSREKLSGGANEILLPGGNHAGFGNYGPQQGDGKATVPAAEQQAAAVRHALEFMGLAG